MITTVANKSDVINTLRTLLRITYGVVPIVAGADKFTHLLTDWSQYLSPGMANILPFSPDTFMLIVGVIEIAAGVIVLVRPAVGAYIVAAWLVSIALTLIFSLIYLDIAVRDIVMAIGAFTLAKLSELKTRQPAN